MKNKITILSLIIFKAFSVKVILFLFTMFCSTSMIAQEKSTQIDSLIQQFVSKNDFGGNVLVRKKGETIIDKSYGFANLSWKIKNNSETKFQIGSISKQFTAAAILLLEQEGKLSVEDKIEKYFPDYTIGKDITIKQLLTHTAAVKNVYTVNGYGSFKRSDISFQELLLKIMAEPLTGRPGAVYNYSNGAFNLLAAIIEKVSGVSYPLFLKDRFFNKLQMSSTGHYENLTILSNIANGYEANGDTGLLNAAYLNDNIHYGSGSLFSTVNDMEKWVKGLNSHTVLNKNQTQKMLTNYINGYGFGISIYKQFGKKTFGHDGRVPGFNCSYLYYPDEELLIIIFSNIQTQAVDFLQKNIAALIFNEPLEKSPETLPSFTKNENDLKQYVGIYRFGPAFKVNVYIQHGALYAASDESEGSELIYTGTNSFFNRNLYAKVKFEKNEQGNISRMKWQPLGATEGFYGNKE